LATALFLIAEPTELVRTYSFTGNKRSWVVETIVRMATILAALILGLVLIRTANGGERRIEGNPGRT
jgi:hypothetical protein